MTRPHRRQELYRRTLAIAGAVVALASTSCGSPVAVASNPTPGPVTADTVRTAFSSSTMDNAHFKLRGTLIKNRTYYPYTGDGVLQLRPVEALLMNVSLQTYSGHGATRIQEVTIGPRTTTYTFPVRAQTTGRFPITVQVLTPGEPGTRDTIAQAEMIVRSTAYNRVALIVTIGAAVFLMAWWGRRFLPRKRRDDTRRA